MTTEPVKLEWAWSDELHSYEAKVPAKDYRGTGLYRFYAHQRPHYCDRGRFLVYVDSVGVSGLDGHEGFPRYFFKLKNLQEEMELWVNGRKEVKDAIKPKL